MSPAAGSTNGLPLPRGARAAPGGSPSPPVRAGRRPLRRGAPGNPQEGDRPRSVWPKTRISWWSVSFTAHHRKVDEGSEDVGREMRLDAESSDRLPRRWPPPTVGGEQILSALQRPRVELRAQLRQPLDGPPELALGEVRRGVGRRHRSEQRLKLLRRKPLGPIWCAAIPDQKLILGEERRLLSVAPLHDQVAP